MDKLEHFATCSCVHSLLSTTAWKWPIGANAMDSLLCMDLSSDDEAITIRGESICALYCLHNGIRHGRFGSDEFPGAFAHFLRENRLR